MKKEQKRTQRAGRKHKGGWTRLPCMTRAESSALLEVVEGAAQSARETPKRERSVNMNWFLPAADRLQRAFA